MIRGSILKTVQISKEVNNSDVILFNSYAKWYAFSVPIGSKLQQGSNALLR